jgi:hypothetical protein
MSGLKLLRVKFDSLCTDPRLVMLDQQGIERWAGTQSAQAWMVWAFHLGLDPAKLGYSPHIKHWTEEHYFERLCRAISGPYKPPRPYDNGTHRVLWFRRGLHMVEHHLREGNLLGASGRSDDPLLARVVYLDDFERLIERFPFGPLALSPAEPEKQSFEFPDWVPSELRHEVMQGFLKAVPQWLTVLEGGTYVPGDGATVPRIADYLWEEMRLDRPKGELIARVQRPASAPRGRPPLPKEPDPVVEKLAPIPLRGASQPKS